MVFSICAAVVATAIGLRRAQRRVVWRIVRVAPRGASVVTLRICAQISRAVFLSLRERSRTNGDGVSRRMHASTYRRMHATTQACRSRVAWRRHGDARCAGGCFWVVALLFVSFFLRASLRLNAPRACAFFVACQISHQIESQADVAIRACWSPGAARSIYINFSFRVVTPLDAVRSEFLCRIM